MTRTLAVIAALLCGSACVEDEVDTAALSTPSGGAHAADDSADDAGETARAVEIEEGDIEKHRDVCNLLPSCGVCSVACDFGQLREHVPPGTCAAFVCDLTDGSTATFHACNPDDR